MHLNILNLYLLKYVNFLHYVRYGQYKCHQQIVYYSYVIYKKIRKSNGPKTDPWGTPAFNSPVLDIASLMTTRCFRFEK